MRLRNVSHWSASIVLGLLLLFQLGAAAADSAAEIDRDVAAALEKLYAESAAAREFAQVAKGILVFPKIVKAGLVIGGQSGEGALLLNGETYGYYRTSAASYGLQAGVQSFGYAMFFTTDEALDYMKDSKGWEVGVGPSVVVADDGFATATSTTTTKEGIYVFFFDQKGLMAGAGIQGSKISRIEPDK